MPEITAQGLLGPSDNKYIIIGDFTIKDVFTTIVGGFIISKIYGIGLIKSILGLFLVLEILHISLGIDTGTATDLISQVDI